MTSSKSRTLRVAVGTVDEYRSATWRVWVQGTGAYLAARASAQWLKLSMHKGDWRLAWTDESGVRQGPAGERVLRRWAPQPQFRPGWTQGPTLIVPNTGLTRPFGHASEESADVHWLPTPPAGSKALIILQFVAPTVPEETWAEALLTGDHLIGTLALHDGFRLLVVHREAEMEVAEASRILSAVREMRIHISSQEPGEMAASMFLNGADPHGLAWVADLALGWENVVGPDGPR